MAKPRVYEVAKGLGTDSKTLLAILKDMGEFVKSPSSSLEPPVARKLREAYKAKHPDSETGSAKVADSAKQAPVPRSKPAPTSQVSPSRPAPGSAHIRSAHRPSDPASSPRTRGYRGQDSRPGSPSRPLPGRGARDPSARPAHRPASDRPQPSGDHSSSVGIPRPRTPRPGNNPYASTQGMGRRPTPVSIPPLSSRPPVPGPPRGGASRRPRPGAGSSSSGPLGTRSGFAGRSRPPAGNSPGAFGRAGGPRSKSRKSKRAKRQEYEMRDAPSLGGVKIPAGGGRKVRLLRGASLIDLAEKINVPPGNLVTVLLHLGEMATATESLDEATFEILGQELGYEIEMVSPEDEDRALLEAFSIDLAGEESEDAQIDLVPRPPVVTIMGHVDHGKTRLLDAVRKTNVLEGEAGGITQHIGAYQVAALADSGRRLITFIDTPGHEAFTAMRARGARVTDIAILVVAADDGIMPQTVEALDHARAAGVPVVVAVNKIDKEGANPARVRQQLAEFGLVAEEYGGEAIFVDVSALTGEGLSELLEAVLLTADAALDLRANPDRLARGVTIEARLDKGRGTLATVLIQTGTLRVGDAIVTGTAHGHVRAMLDEHGQVVEEAAPSRPVQVQGLSAVPKAGDSFIVVSEDRQARQIAERREAAERNAQLSKSRKRISLEDFTRALEEGKVESLNLIIKGDVAGAVEALEEALLKIDVDDSVALRVIHRGVGAVTESDVNLATVDSAIIIGFNVRPDSKARERAVREGVDIRFYPVIYTAIEDIESSLKGLLKPEFEEVQSGLAEVREVFKSSRFGYIAGCYVRQGAITRQAKARVIRDGVVVGDDLSIHSLRRFKDDVGEVRADFECGVGLGSFKDIRIGDEIETTELVEKLRG